MCVSSRIKWNSDKIFNLPLHVAGERFSHESMSMLRFKFALKFFQFDFDFVLCQIHVFQMVIETMFSKQIANLWPNWYFCNQYEQ